MKLKTIFFLSLFLGLQIGMAQQSISDVLKVYNTNSVPYISVQELASLQTEAFVLDAREIEEYKVSHIKNAMHVGFDDFNIEWVKNRLQNKSTQIIVYCTIGVRSEDIAEQLKAIGYNNVQNLYGGLFEWKNNDFPVFNSEDIETENIHTYSEKWSKWLLKGHKIY